MSQTEKKEIVSHRQAEIIIQDSLERDKYLSKILVRSEAEKETLLSLMNDHLKGKYADLVQIDTRKIVFFGDRTYIFLILSNLPNEEFILENLIALLMGKYSIGVSDGWYRYRIMNLMKSINRFN